MVEIVNRSGLVQPDYVENDFRLICWKAHIAPARIRLILGKRRKSKSEYNQCPSGTYHMDGRSITVRITRFMKHEDFKFILAHELGHLKAHLEAKPIASLRRLTTKDYGETKATAFALNVCNCYPVSPYRVKRYLNKERRKLDGHNENTQLYMP